jgi:hypothetical protein
VLIAKFVVLRKSSRLASVAGSLLKHVIIDKNIEKFNKSSFIIEKISS